MCMLSPLQVMTTMSKSPELQTSSCSLDPWLHLHKQAMLAPQLALLHCSPAQLCVSIAEPWRLLTDMPCKHLLSSTPIRGTCSSGSSWSACFFFAPPFFLRLCTCKMSQAKAWLSSKIHSLQSSRALLMLKSTCDNSMNGYLATLRTWVELCILV